MSTKHELNDKFSLFIVGLALLIGICTDSITLGLAALVALAIICTGLRILR